MAFDIRNILGFTGKKTVPPTKAAGVSGTRSFGGTLVNNEKNPNLRQENKYKTYAELLNIPIVSAGVNYYLELVGNTTWSVEKSENDNDGQIADFLRKNMDNMNTPWSNAIRRASMFKFYGFSVQEWTLERRDGLLYMMDLDIRPQKTIEKWDIDEVGNVFGCVQRSPNDSRELYIPRYKMVYIVDDTKDDSPEGRGIFRDIVPVCSKWETINKLETFGFQTNLRGMPVGRIPYVDLLLDKNLTEDQKTALKEPIEKFISNIVRNDAQQSITLDSSVYESITENGTSPSSQRRFDIELLKGSSNGLPESSAAIKRMDQQIAMVLGVENLLLGQDGGSEALARDKSKELSLRIDGVIDTIRQQYQKDYVHPLMRINGIDKELWPTLMPSKQRYQDVESVARTLRDISLSLDATDPANSHIRELMGVPQLDLDEIQFQDSLLDNNNGNSDNTI